MTGVLAAEGWQKQSLLKAGITAFWKTLDFKISEKGHVPVQSINSADADLVFRIKKLLDLATRLERERLAFKLRCPKIAEGLTVDLGIIDPPSKVFERRLCQASARSSA